MGYCHLHIFVNIIYKIRSVYEVKKFTLFVIFDDLKFYYGSVAICQ